MERRQGQRTGHEAGEGPFENNIKKNYPIDVSLPEREAFR